MNKKSQQTLSQYDYRKSAEYKFHEKAMKAFRELSKDDKLQTMVDAGILDKNHKLTRRYGGTGDNIEEKS
ncbi:hypothetical protein GW813_11590 [bacterium]|nr:hypothetical protein [bacterium]